MCLTITAINAHKPLMKKSFFILLLLISVQARGGIPATPVMTLYKFNGDLEIPYFGIDTFQKKGPTSPAGTLTQGSSLIPCLVIRNGRPLTDSSGTPFVGFQVVVDSRKATPASTEQFKKAVAERQSMTVPNHHCDGSVKHVIDIRSLYALEKAPFFDPPVSAALEKGGSPNAGQGPLDEIVRAFHNSAQCEQASGSLVGRRTALERAWSRFIADNKGRWPGEALQQARHLDYTLRTALFEGHYDRGCNAYGACERDVIALTIRNRGGACSSRQGCASPGDFQGVSSAVSQYNIWDEYLTQISGLTSCFLRRDLGSADVTLNGQESPRASYYDKLRGMYEQNLADFQRILFGDDRDLREIFQGASLNDVKSLRHYYHAPAMGKCFPGQDRVEYISGAVATKGNDFALIANKRILVGDKTNGGYFFREFVVKEEEDRDVTSVLDNYPGFVVDGRKVELKRPTNCPAYGIPPGCKLDSIGRYRKTPSWLNAGKPLELQCRIRDRGEKCRSEERPTTVSVGGSCDTQMRPVAGVP